jgi:hypothetical protein
MARASVSVRTVGVRRGRLGACGVYPLAPIGFTLCLGITCSARNQPRARTPVPVRGGVGRSNARPGGRGFSGMLAASKHKKNNELGKNKNENCADLGRWELWRRN